ncbi:sensor histidine kinase [Sphingopyxis sp. PET50]|uniref:sensor histidine kinase n=1 Tax=Sphingopyxis sp. PET50 TaxID=2976533 RepID=UPI0021B06EF6|nr:ATP-binding protein [Sphingopyxis sp. PET50]
MTSRWRQMGHSLTFRLGLTYVALFLTSMLLLFGTAYWAGVYRPLLREAGQVAAEADRLARLDAADGRSALVAALDSRQRAPGHRHAFHALVGGDGRVANSNLPSWPHQPIVGWRLLEADLYRNGEELDYEALVVERRLSDGARLIVGRDVEDIDDRDELFAVSSAWIILCAALLAIGGSFAMSAAVGRRIDAVTRTARRVMAGSLTERIPLRGTGDDFDELAETLNLMLARIEESVESVRRVSDNIAHELRTPLARLRADLDELGAAADETEWQRLAEQASAEAVRLQSIFDALLRIARIESGQHLAGSQRVDLSSLLADAIELHGPAAEDHGPVIEGAIAPGLAMEADRNLLFQAISNLLDNAIKYGGDAGPVRVTAERTGGCIRIAIADSGPGIAPAFRERVKERFFRLPETVGKPGTGLGLSLVAAVVALHRGRMTIEDAEPGTRVVLRF